MAISISAAISQYRSHRIDTDQCPRLSDSGLIAGNFETEASADAGFSEGFVDDAGMILTIVVPGASYATVTAINGAGEIVGYYVDGTGVHGFVDDNGSISKVDVPGATETDVLGVSASGEVYGYYNDSMGQQHGFCRCCSAAHVCHHDYGAQLRRHLSIYDIGQNHFLASYTLGQIGSQWQVAGLGDFSGAETSDMLLRDTAATALLVQSMAAFTTNSSSSSGSTAGSGDSQSTQTDQLVAPAHST